MYPKLSTPLTLARGNLNLNSSLLWVATGLSKGCRPWHLGVLLPVCEPASAVTLRNGQHQDTLMPTLPDTHLHSQTPGRCAPEPALWRWP